MSKPGLIYKWQYNFQLTEWKFLTQEILPEQVVYNNDCPDKDKYFVGIEIDQQNKTGTIYHDRELTEADVIHELLHVKYPNKNEAWVNKIENLIVNINKMDKEELIEWIYNLPLQVLTDELKDDIVEKLEECENFIRIT